MIAHAGWRRPAGVRLALLALVTSVGWTPGSQARAEEATDAPPMLHQLEVEVAPGTKLDDWEQVQVELSIHAEARARPNALVQRQAAKWIRDRLVLKAGAAYPGSRAAPLEQHRASSFVIDFEQPIFEAVRAEYEAAHPDPATRSSADRVRDFVSAYIRKKNLSRSYDAASIVAERREGDCTEHAVLAAALARLNGAPARVVHGVVLLRGPGRVSAFGHAWAEQFDGARWTVVDAALGPLLPGAVHLPLSVLENEGPAHTLHLMKQLAPNDVVLVRLTHATRKAKAAKPR